MEVQNNLSKILLRISEAVMQIRNLDDFYTAIMDEVRPYIKFDDAVLMLLSEDRTTSRHILTMSSEARKAHPYYEQIVNKELEVMASPVEDMLSAEVVSYFELEAWLKKYPEFPGLILMKETQLNHTVALHFENQSGVFALLLFHFMSKPQFKEEYPLYDSIRKQFSIGLDNILANEEILKEKEFKETLLSFSKDISKERDKAGLLQILNKKIKKIFQFDYSVIVLRSEDKHLHQHWFIDIDEALIENPNLKEINMVTLPIANSPFEWIFNFTTISTATDNDIRKYPEFPGTKLYLEMGLKKSIVMPLYQGGTHLGAMLFHYSDPQKADAVDLSLAENTASQIAVAVSNILANEEIAQKKHFAETLLKVSEAATKIRDRESLYHTVMTQIKPIVNYDDAVAVILEDNKSTFRHILTMTTDERREHLLFNEVVQKAHLIKNSPTEQILLNEDFKQYSVEKWLEAYPDFPGLHLMKETGLNYSIVLKLKNQDGVYGLIVFHFKEEQDMSSDVVKLYPNIADQLSVAISNLLANEEIQRLNEKLTQEKEYLAEEIKTSYNFKNIIGSSGPMQQVFEMVEQVAASSSSVIILGETGTGKELIARAIHDRSPRSERPLIKINCATLPAQLLESELFGHEKGSFTGATERRIGKFELAHNGTIFLDEIGELPLELQAKLLRVLQELEIERLGGNRVINVDARVIVATNRNLEMEVQEGNFRADLFFRINVFPIILPPLRNRKEDIPALSNHFLEQFSKRFGKKFKGISKETIKQMNQYHWPGNVRELQHIIERAMIISDGGLLKVDLAHFMNKSKESGRADSGIFNPKTIKDNERELIINTLKHCTGRVRGKDGAAELLDINPSTLESRMRKLGIKKEFV